MPPFTLVPGIPYVPAVMACTYGSVQKRKKKIGQGNRMDSQHTLEAIGRGSCAFGTSRPGFCIYWIRSTGISPPTAPEPGVVSRCRVITMNFPKFSQDDLGIADTYLLRKRQNISGGVESGVASDVSPACHTLQCSSRPCLVLSCLPNQSAPGLERICCSPLHLCENPGSFSSPPITSSFAVERNIHLGYCGCTCAHRAGNLAILHGTLMWHTYVLTVTVHKDEGHAGSYLPLPRAWHANKGKTGGACYVVLYPN